MTKERERREEVLKANQALLGPILDAFVAYLRAPERPKLLACIQFGSTVRQPLKRETDIDLMLVFDDLPPGRRDRIDFILPIEQRVSNQLAALRSRGYALALSPILKTKDEFLRFSSLYLDFPDEAVILFDTDDLAKNLIAKVARWIQRTGARRVQKGLKWYWILRPDLKPGEEFEIDFED